MSWLYSAGGFARVRDPKVYSPALGVVFALTQCIPCVGLIMLLVVNGKATTMLQSEGIRVGLMGADMSQLQ